ncbi:hypothetical protein GF406_24145 [candidate division KSB1 bacterium]|nr:hypothetical protein [candidate division KSB1 bacterium]
MQKLLILLFAWIPITSICDFGNDPVKPDEPVYIEFLAAEDLGCQEERSTVDNSLSLDYELAGDGTLALHLGFLSNCCSRYIQTVDVMSYIITITLKDDADEYCRCVCPWKQVFTFKTENLQTFRVKFYMQEQFMLEPQLVLDKSFEL